MLQYNLRGALDDFRSFNKLQIDEKNLYLNLNFTPQNGSICSFKIRTKFTHYILINSSIHSLYENEFEMRRSIDDLKLPTEIIQYGYIPEGAILNISSRYQRAIFSQLHKAVKTIIKSFTYYTNLVCDIGCPDEEGDDGDDEEEEAEDEQLKNDVFYKKITHGDDVKLIKLAKSRSIHSMNDDSVLNPWTMATFRDWKYQELTSCGSVVYDFSWLIKGDAYWAMSSKMGGPEVSAFKEGMCDRLV